MKALFNRLRSVPVAIALAALASGCTPVDAATTYGRQFGGAGGLVPLKDYKVTAGTNVTDLTLSGLNGDTDGDYDIDADIVYVGGSGDTFFLLRPFGAAVAGQSYRSQNVSGAGAFSTVSTDWTLGEENSGSSAHVLIHAHMTSKSGRIRMMVASAQTTRSGSIYNLFYNVGVASDTSTVISALTVHSSVANAIGAGSYLKVRALGSTL